MLKKRFYTILLLGFFIFGVALNAFAEMQSENYQIPTSVFSGRGALTDSTNYQTDSTLGQSSPLMSPSDPPSSSNYGLGPGFWYTVQVEPVDACEGNFDSDSDVDGSDLSIFAADFGRTDCDTGDPCEGDFDGDNDVDGSDLATFAADFGRTDCP